MKNNVVKKTVWNILMIVFLFHLLGCSTTEESAQRNAIEEMKNNYIKQGVHVHFIADKQLNTFHNMPNNCTVLIVQSSTKEAIKALFDDNDQSLFQLFLNGSAQNILSAYRADLLPGEQSDFYIDKVEGARYLSVISGYYPKPKLTNSRIIGFPIHLKKQGWLWWTNYQADYGAINIQMMFGTSAIIASSFQDRESNREMAALPLEQKKRKEAASSSLLNATIVSEKVKDKVSLGNSTPLSIFN